MDELTGFLDRKECVREVENLVIQSRKSGAALFVLWIGLDRFRQINTSFGHHTGDRVLIQLAWRLKNQACPNLTVGRMGADEFIILLSGFTVASTEAVAERIHHVLRIPMEIGHIAWRQSCSIGLAELADETAQKLLERTDHAMQVAKKQGGGQTVLASQNRQAGFHDTERIRRELITEEWLHEALDTGGLALHYQPILFSNGKGVEAIEALMRCTVRGETLLPDQFIPVAEKTGLIVQLGEWSLLAAARMAEYLDKRGKPVKVAVNISRKQLTDAKFLQILHTLLTVISIPSGMLELELTESLFMDSSAMVRNNLDAAVAAGFSLAIDDFGTGYSCLAYLKDLPASKLKLDRSFVRGLPDDRKSLAIIHAVTAMARDLGMTVVAEGVETEIQRQLLVDAGVTALQGFLFSRPLAGSQIGEWLENFMETGL